MGVEIKYSEVNGKIQREEKREEVLLSNDIILENQKQLLNGEMATLQNKISAIKSELTIIEEFEKKEPSIQSLSRGDR